MSETSWLDMCWYSHPKRAGGKALELSEKTADSMMIVEDLSTGMFGVGMGDKGPAWCVENEGFRLIAIIHPMNN